VQLLAFKMVVEGDTPKQLFNWNLTEATTPAVVVKADSIEVVERVVKNSSEFPSPVSFCC
jgi:hypothetical protein